MSMRGSVVVVTGAARGIGRAIALAFASEGATLALADILTDDLAETASMVAHAGGAALIAQTDISDPADVARFAERVHDELGTPDILINNAGTFSVIAPVWEAEPSAWLRDVHTNLGGAFLTCHAFVGGMVAAGRGRVINVVSTGGVGDPHPHCTSYASSKAGLMRLTEGLAAETREHGVTVFAVAPPAVLTHMTRFIMDDAGGRKWRPGFHSLFDEGRGTPPERVAQTMLALASGRADRLSGRYIRVTDDIDGLVARADEIERDDSLTLRIRG
ncbi:short-chain dehydrogenase [Candidatus Poribacteria bacterium]|nr:short-chain dehydrogenase [Candidatus Poribacteria bacterium]